MDLGETLEELEWLRPWLTPGLDLGPVTSLDEFTGCVGRGGRVDAGQSGGGPCDVLAIGGGPGGASARRHVCPADWAAHVSGRTRYGELLPDAAAATTLGAARLAAQPLRSQAAHDGGAAALPGSGVCRA